MPDIAVGRPFVFRGDDGVSYEFGAGTIYPGMSDEFADHWYTQWHTEAAVRARGGALIAFRQLLVRDPATGVYTAVNHWLPVLLDPAVNPQYEQTLRLLDAPLFQSDLDSFGDLERPPAEPPSGSGQAAYGGAFPPCLGFDATARSFGVARHTDSDNVPTRRVYPGDGISPPVSRSDGDIGRAEREEREHLRQQAGIAAAQIATVRRFVDSPPDPAPIRWPRVRLPSDFVFTDRRAA